MQVQCAGYAFNFLQFDGFHFCLFGGEQVLHFYGIVIMLGAVAGAWLAGRQAKLRGHDPEIVWDLLIYLIVGGVIGLLAGLFSQWGWFRSWWKALLAGLITGIISAFISAPITAYLYGGVTGAGTDVVTAIFRSLGFQNLAANFLQGLTTDPLDKTVSFLIVWLIVQALPLRFVARFPRASSVRKATV